MKKGLVSVIMAVYNCEDTVRESIDSILAQTYTNWQFVICDDCSTDNTLAIVQEYAARYPEKLVVLQNEVNSKLSFSLNHCLEHADGEYIARMDGDDISTPERFEKQVAYLQAHPDCDLVGTAMRRFNEKGQADVVKKPERVDRDSMRTIVPFNHATIMTYYRVYQQCGGYTVSKRTVRAQDYDLWFRFFYNNFKGVNLLEPLYLVREDMGAIRRRTFRVRWNAYQTTKIGFRLLNFPRRWLIKPLLMVFLKSIVPYRLIYLYRKLQEKSAT